MVCCGFDLVRTKKRRQLVKDETFELSSTICCYVAGMLDETDPRGEECVRNHFRCHIFHGHSLWPTGKPVVLGRWQQSHDVKVDIAKSSLCWLELANGMDFCTLTLLTRLCEISDVTFHPWANKVSGDKR